MTEQELAKMVSDYVSAINSFGINYFVCGCFIGIFLGALSVRFLDLITDLIDYLSKKRDKKKKEKTDEK